MLSICAVRQKNVYLCKRNNEYKIMASIASWMDTEMILGPQVEYAPQVAWEKVKAELVERLNTEV